MTRKPMTRELWDRLWWLHFKAARQRHPTTDLEELRGRVAWAMEQTFGPRPEGPEKPPLPVRIGWWASLKVMGMLPLEVKMSPLVKKLIVSLVFGVGAITILVEQSLSDSVISASEWAAIAGAFLPAFWGKFSSNTTVLAPSRQGETIMGPQS